MFGFIYILESCMNFFTVNEFYNFLCIPKSRKLCKRNLSKKNLNIQLGDKISIKGCFHLNKIKLTQEVTQLEAKLI